MMARKIRVVGTNGPAGPIGERNPEDAIVVAAHLRGRLTGPTLLVCGRERVCRPVYGQLMRVPTLPRLSGELLLGYVGELEAAGAEEGDAVASRNPFFDDSLFLEFASEDPLAEARYRQGAHWTILRKMTFLGMISGRGVPVP